MTLFPIWTTKDTRHYIAEYQQLWEKSLKKKDKNILYSIEINISPWHFAIFSAFNPQLSTVKCPT